ncbi:unnamed protein product [Soboliphyme baturini]|uniref:DUF4604 domain-containing protein n=1 Tax=Soboliphyme baturini TaxID=241478 RepID=A0A183IZJ6_9BILA|nr:unnamed protein product [Soboliphyme baturini]
MSRSKQNVSYVKPEEPSFLKEIKQRVGYREPSVHDKMQVLECPSNEPETADGATVVVLDDDNISAEEYAEFMREKAEAEDALKIARGDIRFMKPKRENDQMDTEPLPNKCTKMLKVDKNDKLLKANMVNSRLLSFEMPDDDDW